MKWLPGAALLVAAAHLVGCGASYSERLQQCEFPQRADEVVARQAASTTPTDGQRALAHAIVQQQHAKHFTVKIDRTKPDPEALSPRVIYGEDDRKDYYQLDTDAQRIARSTCVIANAWDLRPAAGDSAVDLVTLRSQPLREKFGGQAAPLCASEAFVAQPTRGFCSGFLVSRDVVATAGHCVADYVKATQTQWERVVDACDDTCPPSWIGDGFCDQECRCEEARDDAGDCAGEGAPATVKKTRVTRFRPVEKCEGTMACERNPLDVSALTFVFGHHTVREGSVAGTYRPNQVYRAQSIIAWALADGVTDYALVRLDRPVDGAVATPLPIDARASAIKVGQSIGVVGYPAGLPVKYAASETTRIAHIEETHFIANLDAYGGNSGSPVINDAGHVVGILVRGANDFTIDWSKQCMKSVRRSDAVASEGVSAVQQFWGTVPDCMKVVE